MKVNQYISDILAQPDALRQALANYPDESIEALRARIQKGEFKRIVLTGMGSSYFSAYSAWLKLTRAPIPAIHVNSAELLHFGRHLIDSHTLLWMNSQSGRSVEIVRILEGLNGSRPAFQLSMTNSMDSPLATHADLAVPIHAGHEANVSTKTYVNTAAMLLLAATQLVGEDWRRLKESMQKAAGAIETYLQSWQARVAEMDVQLGEIDQLLVLGRGASMSAVWNGSLVNKEAAKWVFEGMNVADFRHGPFELICPRLTTIIYEGSSETAKINRDMAVEVQERGAKSLWVSPRRDPVLPTIELPDVDEAALPLAEILPMQLLSILLAQRNGVEPGVFRHIGKITVRE
ncbi:MAG TPA: SIS domain-containing protein [Anaerolineaceae bacterium]|nr:SIS domain-containing protein [Anaerolineaceae bacterium]